MSVCHTHTNVLCRSSVVYLLKWHLDEMSEQKIQWQDGARQGTRDLNS